MATATRELERKVRADAESAHAAFLSSGESSLQLSKDAEREQDELVDADVATDDDQELAPPA